MELERYRPWEFGQFTQHIPRQSARSARRRHAKRQWSLTDFGLFVACAMVGVLVVTVVLIAQQVVPQ